MANNGNVDSGIERLETLLGRRLPHDYRSYLQKENGGTPKLADFGIPKIGLDSTVGVLYGIGVKAGMDIFQWLEELKGDIPDKWIPIGRDLGGNVLLMDLSKEGRSRVLFWDAIRDFPQSTDAENTYLLADSFAQFLKMLH